MSYMKSVTYKRVEKSFKNQAGARNNTQRVAHDDTWHVDEIRELDWISGQIEVLHEEINII